MKKKIGMTALIVAAAIGVGLAACESKKPSNPPPAKPAPAETPK